MIPSMGSILQVGHKMIEDIFSSPVELTEKIDGSQFSFRRTDDGEIEMRSKGQEVVEGNPSSKMFQPAIESVRERRSGLIPGYLYRGEFLAKPKHNALAYDRIPTGHIVIFDVETGPGTHLDARRRQEAADDLGLEAVPVFFEGNIAQSDVPEVLKGLLERDSFLGGVKIEGVVVKNFHVFIQGGHIAMAKYVSAEFKEKHAKEWGESNPGRRDLIEGIIDSLRTEARWRKGVQHLRERGEWIGGPQDIGPLMREVAEDVLGEEGEAISAMLYNHFKGQISRGVVRGIPEWVKEQLLFGAFE